MSKIAIIAAENREMMAIRNIMKEVREKNIYNLTIFEGKIKDKECILTEAGIGKVNAARTTQIIIDNYEIKALINVGSAGGINKELDITDIVIGKDFVQYDFDVTAAGHEKGYVSGIGTKIKATEELVDQCENVIKRIENKNYKTVIGTIATADMFCTDKNIAKEVRENFNAECVEMESAAIAQVCLLDKVPFLVIRSISDSPNGNNAMDFKKYISFAAKRCADILEELVKEI